MTLILSTAALLLGPICYGLFRSVPLVRRVLDAVVALTIGVIIVVHIVPEAWSHAGYWTLAALLPGLAFPAIIERLLRRAHETAHRLIVALAGLGLLLHAIVDGIGLLAGTHHGVAWAIILHRLPVGIAIWWSVRPVLGAPVAILSLVLITLATASGYFVADQAAAITEATSLALLQAFIAGSLVHVVIFGVQHKHH